MEDIDILKRYCQIKNSKIYIVGGAVRDNIMGMKVSDVDFAVDGNFEDAAEYFSKNTCGNFVRLHEDTIRVVSSDTVYDFSPVKGADIYEDLKKRDFTINAMAEDLESGEIIDIANSKNDINDGIIRAAYENTFIDDPLRMLRAFRFASKYGFKIDSKTFEMIKNYHAHICDSAGERILSEILKIFEAHDTAKYIRLMDEAGLIEEIFPFMKKMKTIGKCKYHVVDAYNHSVLSIEFFDILIKKLYDIKYSEKIKNIMGEPIGGTTHEAVLKLAVFLHDMGKPDAMRNDNGRVTFKMHEVYGARKFVEFSKKLKFSNSQSALIRNVIAGHMRPLWLFKQKSSRKAVYRMFCEYGDYSIDIALASLSDVVATRSLLNSDSEESQNYFEFICKIIEYYYDFKSKERLVNGNDIKKITGTDGKKIGEILNKVNEEIFCGRIKDRDEAIEFVKKFKA